MNTNMNNSIDTSKQYFGMKLSEWVLVIHKSIRKLYKTPRFSLKQGDFGYDAYMHMLDSILSIINQTDITKHIQKKLKTGKYIAAAHFAWSNNYIFWKNTYENINSRECNDRATTLPRNLCHEDIDMYRDIIMFVFDMICAKMIERGFESMSLS